MDVIKRISKYFLEFSGRITGAVFTVLGISICDLIPVIIFKELIIVYTDYPSFLKDGKIPEFTINIIKSNLINFNFLISGKKEVFIFILAAIGLMLFCFLLKGVFIYGREYLINSVNFKAIRSLRKDLYSKALDLPMKYYDGERTGEVMSKMINDVQITRDTSLHFITLVSSIIQGIIYCSYMLFINWKLSLLAVTVFPISGYIIRKFAKPLRLAGKRIAENIGHITSFIHETIGAVKIVKIFTQEENEKKKFNNLVHETYCRDMKAVKLMALQTPINEFISIFGIALILLLTGYQIINKEIVFADLAQFILLAQLSYKPLKSISKINQAIQQLIAYGKRILSLIDEPEEHDIKSNEKFIVNKAEVEFKNVNFSYNKDIEVLYNVNFKADSGKTVALVGKSGSGKTTIINLIPKFYKVESGSILIDSVDINTITKKDLRENIGIVPQETILFSGSIKENISYGKPNASFDEIQHAARQANAYEFIQQLENGFETEIGEMGVKLSGGQKQRISIARAILKNPKIMILDEATSSLDSESERLVQDALNHLMQDRTTFIIAHRLSTVVNADLILVLKDGRIVEMGNHQKLLDKNGEYKKLCDLQFNI